MRFDPKLLNPVQAGGAPCTSFNYYYNGQVKALGTVYTRMVLVSFSDEAGPANGALAAFGFVKGIGQPIASSSAMLYPVQLEDGLNCQQVEQAIAELAKSDAIDYAAPYFQDNSGRLLGISNEFIVTLKDNPQAEAVVEQLANATNTRIVEALGSGILVLQADKNSHGNALEMANFFHGHDMVEHAEPNFLVSAEM